MARAQIKPRPKSDRDNFTATIKNTDLSQRETLEEIIINMATAIGAKEIYKQQSSRGTYFYEVQAPGCSCYQSATNTILELSRLIKKP
ncbi:hypothetical protein [Stutzerimonas stutzeri]|jgi:hypothetical protein|uniref:hypothetical protein n=1 Tax=Stutzerimonas stutzeri TaxID=316 RepID=UPI0011E8780B|nr:hypothetical protein [Stutzerimonas stutzeri]